MHRHAPKKRGLNVRDIFQVVGGTKFPQDTFYLDLQPDEAMSRVLTESHCSGDEREIEWTIPVIGLSTHFSKFSERKPGKQGWKSFLETRKGVLLLNFSETTHFPFNIFDSQHQDCN